MNNLIPIDPVPETTVEILYKKMCLIDKKLDHLIKVGVYLDGVDQLAHSVQNMEKQIHFVTKSLGTQSSRIDDIFHWMEKWLKNKYKAEGAPKKHKVVYPPHLEGELEYGTIVEVVPGNE